MRKRTRELLAELDTARQGARVAIAQRDASDRAFDNMTEDLAALDGRLRDLTEEAGNLFNDNVRLRALILDTLARMSKEADYVSSTVFHLNETRESVMTALTGVSRYSEDPL